MTSSTVFLLEHLTDFNSICLTYTMTQKGLLEVMSRTQCVILNLVAHLQQFQNSLRDFLIKLQSAKYRTISKYQTDFIH